MKKIFIDAGAHDGVLTLEYYIVLQERLNGCEIHFFEPLQFSFELLTKNIPVFKDKYQSYTYYMYNKAVWIADETNDFYEAIDVWGNVGSTLHKNKKEKLKLEEPQLTECIDIEKFIINNFSKEDYIVLKLDVEGSEYKIIEHLLENDNAINYINELLIEWHDNFYDNSNSGNLIKLLNDKQINHSAWTL